MFLLKNWKDIFEAAGEYPSNSDAKAYNDGQVEAQRVIKLIKSQLNNYAKNAANKSFHPRNGDVDFHLHAFRHGFNQYITERRAGGKPKKPKSDDQAPTGGWLYDDAFNDTALNKYKSDVLRRNTAMLNAGREFAAAIFAYEASEDRIQFINGFRDGLNVYTTDQFPVIKPPAGDASSVEDAESEEQSESATAGTASSSSAVSSPSSSAAASSSVSTSPPMRNVEEPGPKTPLVTLPGTPYVYDAAGEIESRDERTGVVKFKPFQKRLLAEYSARADQAEGELLTYFDFARRSALKFRTGAALWRMSTLVASVIKVESYTTFVSLLDADAAFVHGYGSGENHHRTIRMAFTQLANDHAEAQRDDDEGMTGKERDEFIDPNNSEAILRDFPSDLAAVIIDLAFTTTINKYFATWTTGKPVFDAELLDATNTDARKSKLVRKLQTADLIEQLFTAWLTRRQVEREPGQALTEHPLYAGFTHFAEAGVLSAIDFLRAFVKNKRKRDTVPELMRYPAWMPSFLWYLLGWMTYTDKMSLTPTMHVESLARKVIFFNEIATVATDDGTRRSRFTRAQVLEAVPSRSILGKQLEAREVDMLLKYLDPDYTTYVSFAQTKGTAIDIVYGLINEGFLVDPDTAEVVAYMTDEARMTWEMRIMQNWLVFSINARVLRPWISDDADTTKFLRELPEKAARELRFYGMLGQYASNFDSATYERIYKKYGKRLPTAPLQDAESDYVKYAMIVDYQVSAWFERCRTFFDEELFELHMWPTISMFWQLDGFPVSPNSVLYKIVETACLRAIREEKAKFLRLWKTIVTMRYPFDLPFADQSDLMLSELIATINRLHSAFTPETVDMVKSTRLIAQGADESNQSAIEANTKAFAALLRKIWPNRELPGDQWISDDAQDELLAQVDAVSLGDDDWAFFGRKLKDTGLVAVAQAASMMALADMRVPYAQLLVSAYLAEMYINCDVIISNIIERNWQTVLTFGDLYAHKDRLVSTDAGYRVYREFVNALVSGDILAAGAVTEGESDIKPSDEEEEEEEDEDDEDDEEAEEETEESEPERARPATDDLLSRSTSSSGWGQAASSQPADVWDVPVVRRARPAPVEPAPKQQRPAAEPEPQPEPVTLIDIAAMESMRGPMHALISESKRVTLNTIRFNKQDFSQYTTGKNAGETFAHDVMMCTESSFTPTQRLIKYAHVRAYALSQLVNIYDELARPLVADSLWEQDSSNLIAQQHDAEVVRKLLSITGPVAQRIFSYEGKKEVYLSGFIAGYEKSTSEFIELFEQDELAGGGGRKSELVGAAMSAKKTRLSFANLVADSTWADSASADAQVGRAVAEGFVVDIERYAWKQRIPYHRALSRVYGALRKSYSRLGQDTDSARRGGAPELGHKIAMALLEYSGDVVAFYRGLTDVFVEREQKPRVLAFEYDALDGKYPGADAIAAAILAEAQQFDVLQFSGSAFDDDGLDTIGTAVRGRLVVVSLTLFGTAARDLVRLFQSFPDVRHLVCGTPQFAHKSMTAGFAMKHPLKDLETLVIDVTGQPGSSTFNKRVAVIANFIKTAAGLRDVEVYVPTNTSGKVDQVAALTLRTAAAASSSITAFYAPGVYPTDDKEANAQVAAALSRNRTAAILVGGRLSAPKARMMLAEHKHRSRAQHNYLEMIAHEGHPRMNK